MAHQALPATSIASQSKVATVLRVTGGNFMEMFDFFLFGFYATQISKAFFPAGNEFASLMPVSYTHLTLPTNREV